MSDSETSGEQVTYVLEGQNIKSTNAFYVEIGRVVNGPGGYFGKNLDSLADCLRGGFGTPDDEPFAFVWRHSDRSRAALIKHEGSDAIVDRVAEVFADEGVPLSMQ